MKLAERLKKQGKASLRPTWFERLPAAAQAEIGEVFRLYHLGQLNGASVRQIWEECRTEWGEQIPRLPTFSTTLYMQKGLP